MLSISDTLALLDRLSDKMTATESNSLFKDFKRYYSLLTLASYSLPFTSVELLTLCRAYHHRVPSGIDGSVMDSPCGLQLFFINCLECYFGSSCNDLDISTQQRLFYKIELQPPLNLLVLLNGIEEVTIAMDSSEMADTNAVLMVFG